MCKKNSPKPPKKEESNKSSQNVSPELKHIKKTRRVNKENNLEDMNPVSERGSLVSLPINKKRSPFERKTTLPPQDPSLKEKSLAHLSNISYCEHPSEIRQAMTTKNARTSQKHSSSNRCSHHCGCSPSQNDQKRCCIQTPKAFNGKYFTSLTNVYRILSNG